MYFVNQGQQYLIWIFQQKTVLYMNKVHLEYKSGLLITIKLTIAHMITIT